MIEELIAKPVIYMVILFIEYVVLMLLVAKYGKSKLMYPLIGLFLIQDLFVNYVISFIFLDLPAKPNEVVTMRLKRYKKKYTGLNNLNWVESWRYNFSVWMCKHLNKYDEGHC